VQSYDLSIQSPNVPTNYKSVIHLSGTFGLAFLAFVPDGGQLGTNGKRPSENAFDVFLPGSSWPNVVDALRHAKQVTFFFDDSGNTMEIQFGQQMVGASP
jgi:hypothetical protein